MYCPEDILNSLPLNYYYISFKAKIICTNQSGIAVGEHINQIFDASASKWIINQLKSLSNKVQKADENNIQRYSAPYLILTIKPYAQGALICRINEELTTNKDKFNHQETERLHKNQRFIYAALDALNDYVYAFDRNKRFIYVNESMKVLYGADLNPIGKTLEELDYPANLAHKLNNEIESIFQTGVAVKDEVHFVSRTGFAAYFDYIYAPVFDEKGTVDYVIGLSRDSTRRKTLEQMLSENEKRLSAIFKILPVGLAVMDKHGNVSLHNEHWKKMASAIPNLLQNPEAFTFQNDEHAQDAFEGEASYLDKNNAQQWIKYYRTQLSDSDGKPNEQVMVVQDISQLKNTLNATFDSVSEMIQVFRAVRNKEGNIIDFEWILNNQSSEKIYGDVIGKSLLQNNPNVIQTGIFQNFIKVIETGEALQYDVKYTGEQFNGWFHQSVVKLGDGVATSTTDITERKKQQEQLESSHKLLTQSESTAQTGGWEFDVQNDLFVCSPGFYALFDVTPDTKLALDFFVEKSTKSCRKKAAEFLKNLITNQQAQEISLVFNINGERRRHLIKTIIEKSTDANAKTLSKILGVNMDISKMHALEQKNKQLTKASYNLKEKQRLERITHTLNIQEEERARLAENLHHSFSQSLFAILLKLDELKNPDDLNSLADFEQIRSQAQNMLKETISESRRISHLLSPAILQEHGLKIALEDMSQNLTGKISVETNIAEIPADTKLLHQTFIYRTAQELITNAIKHANPGFINLSLSQEKRIILIKVTNDGTPFRHESRQIGLGLSSIRANLKLLGGNFNVTTKTNKTVITITLPV
ncbi:PAS domain-containing protein [Pedobacter sp. Leaf170]|uniref:sensor histidine kinase n=1 Tax=Pedobacter sp. Leaf170 TaxID=2876558 RepID=UPI001E56B25D|nr:PAS domain-containing protein [Pedobacter sp. Leaf170]